MKGTQESGDDQFSHENGVKFRFGIFHTRPIACYSPCSINIHEDQRVETEMCEEIQGETMETTGDEIILEENFEVILKHPLGEMYQGQ